MAQYTAPDAFLRLAAKFGRDVYHPLICHLLDVASVAEAVWDTCLPDQAKTQLTQALGLSDGATRQWVAFLAGAHDLGKATPVWQAKGSSDRASAPPWLRGTELYFPRLRNPQGAPAHGVVTAVELCHFLVSWDVDRPTALRLGVITGGHHGVFPTATARKGVNPATLGELDRPQWASARQDLARALAQLVGLQGKPTPPSNAASMVLAGLVSVVDWIGSIEGHFPYDPRGVEDLAGYLQERRAHARQVLRRLHWAAWERRAPAAFRELFPDKPPRPLQRACEALGVRERPALVIVEAPMGEGKTEAAFYLADGWNTASFRGAYMAMPTQATSNQLFKRYQGFLEQRYRGAEAIALQLLHGHASLESGLRVLADEFEDPVPAQADDGESQTAVGVAEWFTYRKRGLLAPFGVGTVDQALLAVLQVKHGFVRLYGLAGKVVVIDEVHAYDVYMSELLERLLQWLGALRSPVVLLSATLPPARRNALLAAYREGLGLPAQAGGPPPCPYPRVTWTDGQGVDAVHVERSVMERVLNVAWLPSEPSDLQALLAERLAKGGCAAVICNTVNRAQELYRNLRAAWAADPERPELWLFHARFLARDRQAIEGRCLDAFGPPGSANRPRKAVLVATQVIEQSLDLDFDVMVTELAPADLLLQRSGRLHRHDRGDRGVPTLHILEPGTDGDGLPVFDRASTLVYDEHILLRTWYALRDREQVAIPGDVDEVIGQVYAEDGEPPPGASPALAERWQATWQDMLRKREGSVALAVQPMIPSPTFEEEEFFEDTREQLFEDRPDAPRSRQARTRFEELPATHVVWLEKQELDLADQVDRQGIKELLMRSVQLRGYWVARLYTDGELPHQWREVLLLKSCRLIRAKGGAFQIPGGPLILNDGELGIVIRHQARPEGEEVQVD